MSAFFLPSRRTPRLTLSPSEELPILYRKLRRSPRRKSIVPSFPALFECQPLRRVIAKYSCAYVTGNLIVGCSSSTPTQAQ